MVRPKFKPIKQEKIEFICLFSARLKTDILPNLYVPDERGLSTDSNYNPRNTQCMDACPSVLMNWDQLLHEHLKVTYHNPWDLGQGARVFDEPRQVIRSIPGVEFVELPQNRENCQCCGSGGNLEMIDAKLSSEIGKRNIEEVLSTGAEAVVTSCLQCIRTIMIYVRRNKVPLDVFDITQLFQKEH